MASFFTSYFRPKTILDTKQRSTALLAIGQPGYGKSRALENWAWQDICAGHGVAVIDPAGDLFNNLLARIAERPDLWPRTVVIDPDDPTWLVRLNPLTAMRGANATRIALFMTDVVVRLWKMNPTDAPRAIWLMTNTFLALAALHLTLLDLPRFLLDKAFRDKRLPQLPPELVMVRTYFAQEFPKSPGGARQWTLPILNKLGGLLFDTDIRLMVSGTPALDFRQVIDEQRIVLVNLPKGILGEDTSSLMAALIVAMFQKAALSRADTHLDANQRPLYFLYLDEFQNYTTQNITDILAESRKYGLSLVLAHQYLAQLSKELQEAVLNTTGTLVCFRVGSQDALHLARNIFSSADAQKDYDRRLSVQHSGSLPTLSVEEREIPAGWDKLSQQLANQAPRWFWVRRKGDQLPMHLRTADVTPPRRTPELINRIVALRQASGVTYGIAKALVQVPDDVIPTAEPVVPKRPRGRPRKQSSDTAKEQKPTTPKP